MGLGRVELADVADDDRQTAEAADAVETDDSSTRRRTRDHLGFDGQLGCGFFSHHSGNVSWGTLRMDGPPSTAHVLAGGSPRNRCCIQSNASVGSKSP